MIVIWSKTAKNDLNNYKKNSKIISEEKLKNYIISLIDYVDNLENFNRIGKFLFNTKDFEIRQLIYHIHRIFYAIGKDKIYILNIYPMTKDMDSIIDHLKNKNIIKEKR